MRTEIASHQALYTLERLHARLAGDLAAKCEEAESIRASMAHVEAVIKLLDPSRNLNRIAVRRRKRNEFFQRGTVWREILDVLREAPEPLTAAEITLRMLLRRGKSDVPKAARQDFEGAVRAALRKREGDGVRVTNVGTPVKWAIRDAAEFELAQSSLEAHFNGVSSIAGATESEEE